MLQSCSAHHFSVSYANSLPLQKSLHFSSSLLVQFRTNRCSRVHIHGSLQGRSLNRNVGEAHQFSSSKSTFASKAFIRFNNYRANEFSRSGRWEKAKYIHASSPGFDQDPKNDSRPEPSLIQNPSDKEEKRNGKPSAQVVNEDNRPTTSGRAERSVGPPEESWWRNPKWIWNFIRSWKGKPAVQAHEVGALLLQLSVVILLMRLLRPGVPFPGGSSTSKSESSSSAYVSVPFSEFLSSVGQNDVENVEIDGFHLSYSLRPSARQARLQKAIQVILPSLFVAW
jgi:cell division protease FtsH